MVDRNPIGICPFKVFRAWRLSGLAVMVVILHLLTGKSMAASDLTAGQLLQLENGEVVVAVRHIRGPSKGLVEATILIDAPASHIWSIMLDCSQIPTFVPGVKRCQVLESGENWEIIRHDVKWVWFFPQISYVFRARYQPKRQIEFVRIEGDLRDMQGRWQLTPMPDSAKTLVCYSVYLDPGFLVPQWLVRNALKTDLPAVLMALRSKVLNSPPVQRQ